MIAGELKQNSLTEGNILKAMLLFALPILIGNIFQQFYNIVDTAVIGNLIGDDALASVGAASPIYNLVISLSNGMTNGFGIIIARFFGASDERNLKKAISLTYILTICMSVILTVASLIGISPLLKFLNTPQNVIAEAENYLRIILMFSVVTMFYNMFAGMFRAVGNSRVPLYFLIISTIVNVPLDLIFVGVFKLGVSGAAYATVISQFVSVILCVISIKTKYTYMRFDRKSATFNKHMFSDLFMTGLSMGLMLAIVSIGSVALQNAVNSLGSEVIAAHTAARKYDDIFMLVLGTISLSASTFAGQNYGAGNMDRVKKGIVIGIKIACVWSVFAIIFGFLFSPFIVKALTGTTNEFIVNTAVTYIKINIIFFPVLSVLLILRSSLQGLGRKTVPLIGSVIELVSKFVAAAFVAPIFGYMGICFLEPIIWIVCAVIVVVDFIVFMYKRHRK